jgi:WD40 repeat protein
VNQLPYEVLYNTFKHLSAPDLCVASCVNRYWHTVASVNELWRDEFARRFGARKMHVKRAREVNEGNQACDQTEEQKDESVRWKEAFKEHYIVDENWSRGRGRVSTLLGHQGTVTCLSLRGPRMISGSDDGSMILWDLCPPQTEPPTVPAVALAGLIDVGSNRRTRTTTTEQVYGAGAGAEIGCRSSRYQQRSYARIFSFHGHGGPIWSLDYRPEDDLLVSGSYDETIKVWRVSTGKCMRSLRGHDGWVSSLSMLTASQVVSSSWDATVRVS